MDSGICTCSCYSDCGGGGEAVALRHAVAGRRAMVLGGCDGGGGDVDVHTILIGGGDDDK